MNKHEKTLELDKVLQMLSEHTGCEETKKELLNIHPSHRLAEAQFLLNRTVEAHRLMASFGAPSVGDIKNCRQELARAEAGGALSMGELLRIGEVLRTVRGILQWWDNTAHEDSILKEAFTRLNPNKYLEEKISGTIISPEEMSDRASPALSDIRRKIRNAQAKIREQLDKMIRSQTYQKYLQEPIVTIRSERFVIPVKAEHRGDVAGLVHDSSASGSTVFIEPMPVVELNNDIKVLSAKEKAEMERILLELSSEAGGFSESIMQSFDAAVEIDLVFSKARLAYKMKAQKQLLGDKGITLLLQARHPLIENQKIVPVDVTLGDTFDTLVITGPNTGGKTVTLKTIGLFSLMSMCGLMLPAAEGSQTAVYEHILADIGDEQSIEQSLSTFSSHITNIVDILKKANQKSLVLLDELGAGTDPVEGAALAMSVLEHLRARGVKTAATTHYAELKAYAIKTNGVENACCEFDVETLSPTYKLLIGVPGRSNAFAISGRLGIDETIIARAKELIDSDTLRFEEIAAQLEQGRRDIERERTRAFALSEKAEQSFDQDRKELEQAREQLKKEQMDAKAEAQRVIARAKAQADALLREIEEFRKTAKSGAAVAAKSELNAKIKQMEQTIDPVKEKRVENYVPPRPIQVGDTVLIFDIDKKAVVLSIDKEKAEVQAGIIKTRVEIKNLRLLDTEQSKQQTKQQIGSSFRNVSTKQTSDVKTEIDVRGMTVDEAIMDIERFLDQCMLNGLNQVHIIHGKGTGALRKGIWEHLKRYPSVKTQRPGVFGEGEMGVTVVELK